ncbi:MAG: peptidylprolyl isomerase [Ferruginibacter sp.]
MKLLSVCIIAALLTGASCKTAKQTVTKESVVTNPVISKPAVAGNIKKTDQAIRIRIITDSGSMIVKLYDSTPLHRDNFVKLVTQGFYDSLMFHRVIPGFMIQGGDPLSKNAPPSIMLGNGGDNMARIPAEFRQTLRHKRGVLAAARDGNPLKASSACQFYIVDGKTYTDSDLDMMESRKGFKYSISEREIYKSMGGTPSLDMEYTVFGELESGLEIISKIAMAPRDANNRPLGDVRMRMEIIK